MSDDEKSRNVPPSASSIIAISRCPSAAAKCRAVCPLFILTLTSAPAEMSKRTISVNPIADAAMIGHPKPKLLLHRGPIGNIIDHLLSHVFDIV